MNRIFLLCIFVISTVHAEKLDYHSDIAPILRDYCGGCHNEDDYDGDFSIETFRALMEGGESGDPIVTPGNIEKSFLASTILKTSRPAMPPKKEPQLSSEQINIITKWIEQGAEGPTPENDHSILATLNVPEIAATGKAAKPVTAGEYSPDRKRLAIGMYGKVDIGDLTIEVDGKVNAVHFSPDGGKIIIATGITGLKGVATIHDAISGEELLRVGEGVHRDILYDAEFSPDGALIATAGYDRTIRIWNVADGSLLQTVEGHNGAIFDVAFSPDGSLIASASADETGKIWRVSDGERLDTLNQPEGEQFRIDFTPDGKYVVAAGGDKKIRLWRLISRTKPRINPVLHARFAHEEAINEMTVSPDGKWLATASSDDSVKIWSLPDLQQVQMYADQPDLVSILRFGPDGTLLAGRMDGEIKSSKLQGLKGDGEDVASYDSGLSGTISPRADAETKIYSENNEAVMPVEWPAEISGTIEKQSDVDDYLFNARKGEKVIVEVNAARAKSMLDSKVEILTADGEKLERVVLQAVRDSWFTFRGKDSNTSDDFRVHNWEEMELNEYLYADGEVVKLWHYPRGPDSGFKVYPGFGNRKTYFDTTPLSHPLGGPCYIVAAYAPGSDPAPNGLPVFHLYWENDDDGDRMIGRDSRLTFTAPEDGSYRVRVSDVRGFGGEKYTYQLKLRPPKPDFKITNNGDKAKISPGSGQEIEFKMTPVDGFEGEIDIHLKNLPAGFSSYPVTIEARQRRAYLAVHAADDAVVPPAEELMKIRMVASAEINGETVTKTMPALGNMALSKPATVKVDIFPDSDAAKMGPDGILEITVPAGDTVSALVRADRLGFKGRVQFGKDDSGRNMPHGVFVDNIGLSGLMIPEGKTEQRFWITAARWVPETTRIFHLRTTADGGQASKPVRLKVVR